MISETLRFFGEEVGGARIIRPQEVRHQSLLFGPHAPSPVRFARGILSGNMLAAGPLLAQGLDDNEVCRRSGLNWRTVQRVRRVLEARAGRPLRQGGKSIHVQRAQRLQAMLPQARELLLEGFCEREVSRIVGVKSRHALRRLKLQLVREGRLPEAHRDAGGRLRLTARKP